MDLKKRYLLPMAMLLAAASTVSGEPTGVLDLDSELPKGETSLWSPLFQASWDKLNAAHAGRLEKVVPPNPLMTKLDQFEWDEKAVMPEKGYAVFAGPATDEFARSTAAAIKKEFGVEMAPDQIPKVAGGNAIYAILKRELEFERQFFRSKTTPLRFKDGLGKIHELSFFGTTGELSDNYGASVRVLDYADAGKSFVLSIATDKESERLVIYRPAKGESFAGAIKHVAAAIKTPLAGRYGHVKDGNLHKNDTVKIPYIDLESETQFTAQLGGLRHYRGDPEPWAIYAAYQLVNFELFEKGARVRVETAIADGPFGEPEEEPVSVYCAPRNFICDVPFFVFIWNDKAALPYFAGWMDGAEVFQPMPKGR